MTKYTCIIYIIILSLQNSYAEIIDKVIAAVYGEAITLSTLENELKMLNLSDAKEVKQREVLNDLIDRKLVLREARRMGIELAITMEKIENQIESLKAKYPSEEIFLKYLEKEGLSINDIKEEMKESLMRFEMINRKFMRPLNADSNLFERRALTYYEDNKQKQIDVEKIKLQQVVVLSSPITGEQAAEAKSQEIWKKLKQGMTFSDIHQTYYDDTNVMVDYEPDYVEVDKLIPALQDAISKLKIADLSKPILTTRGQFIIKIIDHKPVRQKLFDEVADEIKKELMSEQVQKDLNEWLKKQRKSADIRILDPKYRTPLFSFGLLFLRLARLDDTGVRPLL